MSQNKLCLLTALLCIGLLSSSLQGALTLLRVTDVPLQYVSSTENVSLMLSNIISSPVIELDIQNNNGLALTPLIEASPTASVTLKIIGGLYNYPNPFSFSKGQTEIGYRLSQSAYLTLKIYTLTGQEVYSQDISPSDYGAAQYNKIPFSRSLLQGSWLAPGTYLYLIVHEGKVLGKNRMVVLP